MKRGFTIFFAVLTASLVLAIGLAIYDLTVRELDLAGTANQSQYAIYAADTGAECALFWDYKYGPEENGSAFATTSDYITPTGVLCNGQSILPWDVVGGNNAATTTFTLTFPPQVYCAEVEVAKYLNNQGALATTINSRGYNTCAASPNRLERALQVTY